MATLKIIDLYVNVDENPILKGINLEIKTNEIHAIMGPNGAGKSTLAAVIMGHPKYEVISGSILLDDQDILKMTIDERARAGLFLGMQYPAEISGVTNSEFIMAAMKKKQNIPLYKFIIEYDKNVNDLQMNKDLPHRFLNEGFSGGEKKRNEILQMKMLKPKIAILDEIDSGLDVDALRIVGENVNKMVSNDFGCLVITHYQRLLDYIIPNFVHILIDGKIVKTGDKELIKKIDTDGYDWIIDELGIEIKRQNKRVAIGSCALQGKKHHE